MSASGSASGGGWLRIRLTGAVARPSYSLTMRSGPRVLHEDFDDLGSALARLSGWVEEQRTGSRRGTVDLRYRRFEPIEQVAARAELAGPRGLRGGIDVRGDGSSEAYTGRWRRRLVEPLAGEDAAKALGRTLHPGGAPPDGRIG